MKPCIKKFTDDLPIISSLRSYTLKNYTKFHMPGHQDLSITKHHTKNQKFILNVLKDFQNKIFAYDLTEVENLDNLQKPALGIKKSQEIMSNDFNVKRTFYSTQGSTLGVMSMIMSVCKKNDKIIMPEMSHKSSYQAIKLMDIKPIFIKQDVSKRFSHNEKIDIQNLIKIVNANKDAVAIFITSPDYYGVTQNIEIISKIAHENNMKLLVDSAHGAHFNYMNPKIPTPIELGADIQVMSFHKTLPSFTSTAIIQVSKDNDALTVTNLQNTLNTLQTTSPSYPMLASIELIHYLMKKYGKSLYKSLISKIITFKKHLSTYENIYILDSDDKTRLVISIDGISGEDLYHILQYKYNILTEMHNLNSCIFITNPLHTKIDFNRLEKALKEISRNKDDLIIKNKNINFSVENEEILKHLLNNVEKISDRNLYVYPPGTPFLKKGDIITKNTIDKAKEFMQNDSKILQDL